MSAKSPRLIALSTRLLFTAVCLTAWPLVSLGAGAKVVELFTSHGCSSCPSADKLLADLIEQDPELVALEFHVDYWNQLVHGASGNWVDPFSSEAYTLRQYQYNQTDLSGRKGVYTPQMIVNGAYAAVGSDRRRVTSKLEASTSVVDVKLSRPTPDQLTIDLDNPSKQQARVWLVIFDIKEQTKITGGENDRLVITNHNIVKQLKPVDTIDQATLSVSISVDLADGEGCAVLVQADRLGPVFGAANCPVI